MRWLRSQRTRLVQDQRGVAVLLTATAGMTVLLTVAALVLDLGLVRATRSEARLATDSASSAAALTLAVSSPYHACQVALGYATANLSAEPDFSAADCSPLIVNCDDETAEQATSTTDGDWTITVTYPVADDSPLLSSPSVVGHASQSISVDDGGQCERIGVTLSNSRAFSFASLFGAESGSGSIHSVSVGRFVASNAFSVNLVILERYDCDAMVAEGSGGGVGGIRLGAVYNPNSNKLVDGTALVDSDATGSGCGTDGTIDIDGNTTLIRADGPTGCDGQLGTYIGQAGLTVGAGCGQIRTLAPGTPGCNHPACTSTGTIAPIPQALEARTTRAPVDHRFNCKPSYPFPFGWEIEGCTAGSPAYIDNLIAAYGTPGSTPAGFQTWTGLGYPCAVQGPPSYTIAVSGDIRIDCPLFEVKRGVDLQNASVIFDGDVAISGSGTLSINTDGFGLDTPSSTPGVVYFRDGDLSKAGGSSLYVNNSMVYLSAASSLSIQGGTGVLSWTAPFDGDFDNLALWSDSAVLHELAGQSFLALEGAFFAPLAKIDYRGGGTTHQVKAQFISNKLRVLGQGLLIIEPVWERLIQFPSITIQQLVR